MFAVITTGGKQYRVREGGVLRVEKIPAGSRKKDKVSFSEVLLTSDGKGSAKVGNPTVSGARVDATIVKDGKGAKIVVVKYKPKTRYRRTRGHRQQFTELRIDKITI